jgi:hypothetical protein
MEPKASMTQGDEKYCGSYTHFILVCAVCYPYLRHTEKNHEVNKLKCKSPLKFSFVYLLLFLMCKQMRFITTVNQINFHRHRFNIEVNKNNRVHINGF